MNQPPTDGVRLDAEALRQLVADIFQAVSVPREQARLIAGLMVETDLRGVVSHGVLQMERYVGDFRAGRVNPKPAIQVLREGPGSLALNGDGGLGIVVATQAMETVLDKAAELGTAAATTTYHGHIGSAGKYVGMALRRNMLGIAFSGRNAASKYKSENTVLGSIQGSPPMAMGAPAGPGQPDFMLDMATGMPGGIDFEQAPALFFRGLGLAHAANIFSGTLGGQMLDQFERASIQYERADQSGFFAAFAIDHFVPVDAFKADMDHLMAEVAGMQPLPGQEYADLPGGPEWRRQRQYEAEGVPITGEAQRVLGELAAEFGLGVPW
ncbi:MAG: hypothetical protein GKR89_21970 [Candidatus Latescibacteria bacterium]|nr:hypothetical protein [Candidatus Latescibacterota bacterium]